jgi:ABC-type uncharacterized transport system auxiliary subunit
MSGARTGGVVRWLSLVLVALASTAISGCAPRAVGQDVQISAYEPPTAAVPAGTTSASNLLSAPATRTMRASASTEIFIVAAGGFVATEEVDGSVIYRGGWSSPAWSDSGALASQACS